MSLRNKLNNNPLITISAVAVALGVVVMVLYSSLSGGVRYVERPMYYFDLNTGSLFVAEDQFPPIEAPSGKQPDGQPAGVRAMIHSCGSCRDDYSGMTIEQVSEAGAEITYLQRYTSEVKRRIAQEGKEVLGRLEGQGGILEVTKPQAIEWQSGGTRDGDHIRMHTLECPDGQEVVRCSP